MKRFLLVALFAIFFAQSVNASPVNINTADAEAIATALKGVGPSKAAAIVDFRTKNGPFQLVEDLVNVKGIGEKTLEKNRDDIIIVSEGNS